MKSHSLTPVEARLARQNHYDRLHHLRRIAILSNKRRLDMVELIQLRQSRSHVAGQRPSEPLPWISMTPAIWQSWIALQPMSTSGRTAWYRSLHVAYLRSRR
jgi:hypothetical protein